ncbi:C-type lectin domain family 2 member D-like [Colius striatus]|uniref:C-type lectin domain family 2 member D-like n=1 Tax=Colius striatus TaxID=57412 RepID=UPI002B1D2332|nr:C-type lectin domain family 2 member D-like [Colius striatus]XP_061875917.1 C-type lectin domain family 2 member D-like [Colius striatus]XP_061875918.1 C-type lectin domain family 2 member D-like [Colius striatus]XP_061875919.1 C-type lectin domain family 2 member D-like [Colius striatus]XP_061875920.1 C-type lectin domain family 2 member D-like [Colius striatus]
MGHGEEKIICSKDGNVEDALNAQDKGASPQPEVPEDTPKRSCRGVVGKFCELHPVYARALAVLLALILALSVALAVQSAGSRAAGAALPAAPGLGCAYGWVGYRDMCYYVSVEKGNWEWSQLQCWKRRAWLAMLQEEWEMEFLQRLKGDLDCWVGVIRWGEHLERVDGSNFTFKVSLQGEEHCLLLINGHLRGSSCLQKYQYICSKLQAMRGTTEQKRRPPGWAPRASALAQLRAV